ncbi:hypothetical protein PR048_028083 [Dryococelus australis]|uniref:Uncharacterized protein n=1 Tax=Dryococelus australis TaxID=614101 RepID=A0ABQ9GI73_9NEOP|nr:hypothetical protein PR048_028083 [Dryococelus australis]
MTNGAELAQYLGREIWAANGRGTRRSPRKPADQRHHPVCSQFAKNPGVTQPRIEPVPDPTLKAAAGIIPRRGVRLERGDESIFSWGFPLFSPHHSHVISGSRHRSPGHGVFAVCRRIDHETIFLKHRNCDMVQQCNKARNFPVAGSSLVPLLVYQLQHLPPGKTNRVRLARENRAGRYRRTAGFLRDLPFHPPLNSDAAPYPPRLPFLNSQYFHRATCATFKARFNPFDGGERRRQEEETALRPDLLVRPARINFGNAQQELLCGQEPPKCPSDQPSSLELQPPTGNCATSHVLRYPSTAPKSDYQHQVSIVPGDLVCLRPYGLTFLLPLKGAAGTGWLSCLLPNQGEPGSIPGRVTPGFSQVVIEPDDAAVLRTNRGTVSREIRMEKSVHLIFSSMSCSCVKGRAQASCRATPLVANPSATTPVRNHHVCFKKSEEAANRLHYKFHKCACDDTTARAGRRQLEPATPRLCTSCYKDSRRASASARLIYGDKKKTGWVMGEGAEEGVPGCGGAWLDWGADGTSWDSERVFVFLSSVGGLEEGNPSTPLDSDETKIEFINIIAVSVQDGIKDVVDGIRASRTLKRYILMIILGRPESSMLFHSGAAVIQRLELLPANKVNRVRFTAVSLLDFRAWESCWGGGGCLPFPPGWQSGAAPYASRVWSSTDPDVKSSPNLSNISHAPTAANTVVQFDPNGSCVGQFDWCRERKINIKASERVNVDVFMQNKRPRTLHRRTGVNVTPFVAHKCRSKRRPPNLPHLLKYPKSSVSFIDTRMYCVKVKDDRATLRTIGDTFTPISTLADLLDHTFPVPKRFRYAAPVHHGPISLAVQDQSLCPDTELLFCQHV